MVLTELFSRVALASNRLPDCAWSVPEYSPNTEATMRTPSHLNQDVRAVRVHRCNVGVFIGVRIWIWCCLKFDLFE